MLYISEFWTGTSSRKTTVPIKLLCCANFRTTSLLKSPNGSTGQLFPTLLCDRKFAASCIIKCCAQIPWFRWGLRHFIQLLEAWWWRRRRRLTFPWVVVAWSRAGDFLFFFFCEHPTQMTGQCSERLMDEVVSSKKHGSANFFSSFTIVFNYALVFAGRSEANKLGEMWWD